MTFSGIVILLFVSVLGTLFLTILGIGCSYLMKKKALQKSKWSQIYKKRAIGLYMTPGVNLFMYLYALSALIIISSGIITTKENNFDPLILIASQFLITYFCVKWARKTVLSHKEELKDV